jgi:hypothetical protein
MKKKKKNRDNGLKIGGAVIALVLIIHWGNVFFKAKDTFTPQPKQQSQSTPKQQSKSDSVTFLTCKYKDQSNSFNIKMLPASVEGAHWGKAFYGYSEGKWGGGPSSTWVVVHGNIEDKINFKIAINRDTGYFKETLSDSKTNEVGVKSTGTCDLSSNLKKKF